MANVEVCDLAGIEKPVVPNPLSALLAAWQTLLRRIDDRRTIHQLYQLDEHLLRDMGFDPEAIYAAREGALGEVKRQRCRDRL